MTVLRVLAALAAPILLAAPAAAQQGGQQLLGQFADWSAYTATTDKGKVCFVISQPKSRAPEGLKRDPAYFFVTHRAGDRVRNEVSLQVGFAYRQGSTAAVAIGPDTYNLVTQDERAWSNGQDDAKLVASMRKAGDMVVKSTSTRGNVTTDTFSLKGVSAALDRIDQECR